MPENYQQGNSRSSGRSSDRGKAVSRWENDLVEVIDALSGIDTMLRGGLDGTKGLLEVVRNSVERLDTIEAKLKSLGEEQKERRKFQNQTIWAAVVTTLINLAIVAMWALLGNGCGVAPADDEVGSGEVGAQEVLAEPERDDP